MKKLLSILIICPVFLRGYEKIEIIRDTIISDTIALTQINKDSIQDVKKDIFALSDDITWSQVDKKWLEELSIKRDFDTLYQDINSDYKNDISFDELPTELLKERLELLNQKTLFHIEYNPILERIIKNFLKNRREFFLRLMNISQYYFPMFEQEIIAQDIPIEMKYLPIVESALNPIATSKAGAKGLWQFMYQTGKLYGLQVSNYVDERADPIRSTQAAIKYLKNLYKIFDDWDLVLAAYNSGPGNVTKAIRRSGGKKNYWNIRPYLHKETAGYVPAFFATLYIFEYAKEHGFFYEKRENIFLKTDTITVKRFTPFKEIAPVVGLDIQEIEFLNPSYRMQIVPYSKQKKYGLRLPVELIGKFVSNEQTIYDYLDEQALKREKPLPELIKQDFYKGIHKVKKGETLSHIASLYKVKVASLKKWNNLKNSNLKIGQRIIIR